MADNSNNEDHTLAGMAPDLSDDDLSVDEDDYETNSWCVHCNEDYVEEQTVYKINLSQYPGIPDVCEGCYREHIARCAKCGNKALHYAISGLPADLCQHCFEDIVDISGEFMNEPQETFDEIIEDWLLLKIELVPT